MDGGGNKLDRLFLDTCLALMHAIDPRLLIYPPQQPAKATGFREKGPAGPARRLKSDERVDALRGPKVDSLAGPRRKGTITRL